jgi:hypothetical protein
MGAGCQRCGFLAVLSYVKPALVHARCLHAVLQSFAGLLLLLWFPVQPCIALQGLLSLAGFSSTLQACMICRIVPCCCGLHGLLVIFSCLELLAPSTHGSSPCDVICYKHVTT